MASPGNRHLQQIGEWLLAFALVAAAGLISRLFTRSSLGISGLWLANGLMLGLLLHSPRQRWPALFTACAAGQLAGGMLAGDALRVVLGAMAYNTLEVLAAAWPLRSRVSNARQLSLPGNFLWFLAAGTLAPALSSAMLAIHLSLVGGFDLRLLENWYTGHALGIFIAAPVVLALHANALARLLQPAHRTEALGGMLAIALVTTAVFWQSHYPLLYLIFPPMLLAALRGGFAGTAFGLILVTTIAALLTSHGRGPLMLMTGQSGDNQAYLMLQVFILALLLTCYPVAVAVSAWQRNQRSERRLRKLLELLAEHSSDVTILTDLGGRRFYVSPSVREVLGWEPEQFLRGTFRDLVHPSHLEEMQRQLEYLATVHRGKATITFPAQRADGRRLWLESRVRYFRDPDFLQLADTTGEGTTSDHPASDEGFVVTLRNISRRRQTEQALEAANRKLSSLALQDELTGLGNRRQFEQQLADSWLQCAREGSPMAVILLDVDYFKRYNDHYGHVQGDHCLRELARAIAAGVRSEEDCAARYGGEEFAVVLVRADAAEAALVAERIRHDVEQLAMPHAGSPFGHVTVSVGVAHCVPRTNRNPETLVRSADRALYRSKAQDRNRVTLRETGRNRIADSDEAAGPAGPSTD